MNKNKDNERYFRTQNFFASAFLFAKGYELVNIDKTLDPKKADFVFKNSPELEIDLHVYNFAPENSKELLINARTLFSAIKQLKSALYQDTF